MRLRQVLLGMAVSLLAALMVVALVAVSPSPHAGAAPEAGIAPDITLTPGEPPKFFEYKSTAIGADRAGTVPEECRTHPAFSNTCDALRLKLNLSKKKRAENFVIIELTFEAIEVPTLVIAVAGLSVGVVPDMDLTVYRTPTAALAAETTGGAGLTNRERVGFVAKQAEYDLVVNTIVGLSQGYTLRAYMSDELFTKPFESLDEVLKRAEEVMPAEPFDETFTPPFEGIGEGIGDGLDLGLGLPEITPIVDRQISNLGFGINEQLGAGAIDLSGGRRRDVVAVGKAPSGIALILAMLVLPLGAAAGGAFWLRRRRQALI